MLALVLSKGAGGNGKPSDAGVISSPPTTKPPVGVGYLAKDGGSVVFIQWTDDNGALSGSAQEVGADGQQPPDESTSSNTLTVSGSLRGSTLALSFDHGAPSFGQVSGGAFTLDFPQQDGTLAPVTFHRASAAGFNQAVEILQQQVSSADQQAATAKALAQKKQVIDGDLQSVNVDLGKLSTDPGLLAGDVKAVSSGLPSEAQALAQTKQDRDTAIAQAHQYPDGNNGQVCNAAFVVQNDAYAVQNQLYSVQTSVDSLTSDISGVRQRIQTTQSDYSQLVSDMAQLPGYIPAGTPSQNAVSAAESNMGGTVASEISTANQNINQANSVVSTAFQYADEALQAGNCSSGQSTATQIPQVT